MSGAKLTPGPWGVLEQPNQRFVKLYVVGADGGLVASWEFYSSDEAMAALLRTNANLIAAAPDLLAVAEELTREDGDLTRAIDLAYAAVRAARGTK